MPTGLLLTYLLTIPLYRRSILLSAVLSNYISRWWTNDNAVDMQCGRETTRRSMRVGERRLRLVYLARGHLSMLSSTPQVLGRRLVDSLLMRKRTTSVIRRRSTTSNVLQFDQLRPNARRRRRQRSLPRSRLMWYLPLILLYCDDMVIGGGKGMLADK